MESNASTPEDYMTSLPEERKEAMARLRQVMVKNLPSGFIEVVNQGMLGYVVPHSIFPPGYHCDPKQPLPFMALASQKNFISLYHMGIYASPELLLWFQAEYPKHCKTKLDMGKSCIRLKKVDQIPYELIGELASKMTTDEWVSLYEKNVKQ